jgi:hypothetical protein
MRHLLRRFRPSCKRDIFFKKVFDTEGRVTYIRVTGGALAFCGGVAIWQSEANDRTSHLLRGGAVSFGRFLSRQVRDLPAARGVNAPRGEESLRIAFRGCEALGATLCCLTIASEGRETWAALSLRGFGVLDLRLAMSWMRFGGWGPRKRQLTVTFQEFIAPSRYGALERREAVWRV